MGAGLSSIVATRRSCTGKTGGVSIVLANVRRLGKCVAESESGVSRVLGEAFGGNPWAGLDGLEVPTYSVVPK